MVARTAVSSSRADGLGAALGMGMGGLIFATAALLGLNGLLLAVPSLYLLLKAVGGLYLAYLGLRIWRGANAPLNTGIVGRDAGSSTVARSLALGLTTQLSNPKTAIVYASVFAAFLPVHTSLAFNFGLAGLVFLIEAGWYTLVALALSSDKPRNVYLRCKAWIDRAAGGLMIALGLKLMASASQRA
jgi:threonine/homoserine/homoserine lactone efflux protein